MKTGLIYHTDFRGFEILHEKKELRNACKVFDELIVLSADTSNLSQSILFHRENRIFDMLKSGTKVIVGTHSLKEQYQYIPALRGYKYDYPKLDFTGTYFNEESFFHPKFRQIWRGLNKIEGRKVWIPYTGSFWNEMFTLSQIGLLYRKFDTIFLQPNFYQRRYDKQPWQMKNISRFIKNHGLGVEFEIDSGARTAAVLANRALNYWNWFSDIEDKAFYTGGLDIGKYPDYYQEMVEKC